jgi:hypothetical protein
MDNKELNGWSVAKVNNLQPFIVHIDEVVGTSRVDLSTKTHVTVIVEAIAFNAATFAESLGRIL